MNSFANSLFFKQKIKNQAAAWFLNTLQRISLQNESPYGLIFHHALSQRLH